MRWLYAVAALAKGRPVAGLELATGRDDAFHRTEDHLVLTKRTDDDTRTAVLQLPWDLVLDRMAEALGDDAEAREALRVLRGKLPAGVADDEPPRTWLNELAAPPPR